MQSAADEDMKVVCKAIRNLRVITTRGEIDGDYADLSGKIARTEDAKTVKCIQTIHKPRKQRFFPRAPHRQSLPPQFAECGMESIDAGQI